MCIALRICLQHPHKALAQLAAALQHFMLLWGQGGKSHFVNAPKKRNIGVKSEFVVLGIFHASYAQKIPK